MVSSRRMPGDLIDPLKMSPSQLVFTGAWSCGDTCNAGRSPIVHSWDLLLDSNSHLGDMEIDSRGMEILEKSSIPSLQSIFPIKTSGHWLSHSLRVLSL